MLQVEELSSSQFSEDFLEVTSLFQGSKVKTVYNLGDNDAKCPDAEIDDEHTRNSLASPLYLQEREASASLLQVYHSQHSHGAIPAFLHCTAQFHGFCAGLRQSFLYLRAS